TGDGTLHAWSIYMRNEVACWNSHIGVATCLKWAPHRAICSSALSWSAEKTSSSTAWHAVSTGTMFTVYYKPRK
ncbi:hypothetical protein MKW98_006543, partial [Papaver atlanticum]